jgi:hypothetical protein
MPHLILLERQSPELSENKKQDKSRKKDIISSKGNKVKKEIKQQGCNSKVKIKGCQRMYVTSLVPLRRNGDDEQENIR